MPLHRRFPSIFIMGFLATLIATLAVVLPNDYAQAATPPDDNGGVILTPLMETDQSSSGSISPMAVCPSCTCSIKTHTPHNSGHVAGNINVTADVTCTKAQPRVRVTVDLLKDDFWAWTQYGPRGDKTVHNKAYVSTNSAGKCTPGTYRGHGSGYYDAANGNKFGGSHDGPTREITCK
jgi:hypothetical protein